MSKRKLDSKYRDLADWVKQIKYDGTSQSLAFILSCIYDFRNEGQIGDILNDLNKDLTLNSSNDLIPVITDIYNDNYKLEEPKYYWKSKELTSSFDNSLYLSTRGAYEGSKLDKNSVGLLTSQSYRIAKITKSKVIEFLNNSTNLTIDNFTPVEEIEND